MQSGFPRAEARSYHGEYNHLCEVYVLDMDQWHTTHARCNWRIQPPSNGHQQVTWEPLAMTMPGAKAYIIAQSHDEA